MPWVMFLKWLCLMRQKCKKNRMTLLFLSSKFNFSSKVLVHMSLYLLMRMQCFSVNDALFRHMKRTVGIVRGVILATSKRLNDYIKNPCAG